MSCANELRCERRIDGRIAFGRGLVCGCGIRRTADEANVVRCRVPFDCRVVHVIAGAQVIGGSTVFTDVDVTVMNGATDLLASRIPVVNSSVLAAPLEGTLSATEADRDLSADDILDLDIDITGGSSPTMDGCFASVFVVRQ